MAEVAREPSWRLRSWHRPFFMTEDMSRPFPRLGLKGAGPCHGLHAMDFKPIRIRTNIYQPDDLIVLDRTLLSEGAGVTAGLKEHGWILVNSPRDLEGVDRSKYKVAIVDAGAIAVSHRLGSPTSPVVIQPFWVLFKNNRDGDHRLGHSSDSR